MWPTGPNRSGRDNPTGRIAGIAAVALVINTTRVMVGHVLMPRFVPWNMLGLAEPVRWGLWIAASPLLALVVRRAAACRRGSLAVLTHVFSALCIAPVNGFLVAWAAFRLELVVVTPALRGRLMWNPTVAVSGAAIDAIWGYCVIMGFYYAMTLHSRTQERNLRAAELETSLARAKLEALQLPQLQPHFLFNVLHSTALLAATNGAAARDMLVRLADLLRRSLGNRRAFVVPLDEELEFLDRYLGIEKVRFADRLRVEFRIDPGARTALVPTLVLQPLVENAIRHAIARRAEGGTIVVSAAIVNSTLLLRVDDDGPGLLPPASPGHGVNGVGLSNLRARLEQLFPSAFEFAFGELPGRRGWSVRITVPLRFATSGANSNLVPA